MWKGRHQYVGIRGQDGGIEAGARPLHIMWGIRLGNRRAGEQREGVGSKASV